MPLLDVLSLYLPLILFCIYCFHVSPQSCIWNSFFLYCVLQDRIFCLEVNHCNRSGWCSDLKCRGQAGICAPVLGSLLTSLSSAKQEWDDDS